MYLGQEEPVEPAHGPEPDVHQAGNEIYPIQSRPPGSFPPDSCKLYLAKNVFF